MGIIIQTIYGITCVKEWSTIRPKIITGYPRIFVCKSQSLKQIIPIKAGAMLAWMSSEKYVKKFNLRVR